MYLRVARKKLLSAVGILALVLGGLWFALVRGSSSLQQSYCADSVPVDVVLALMGEENGEIEEIEEELHSMGPEPFQLPSLIPDRIFWGQCSLESEEGSIALFYGWYPYVAPSRASVIADNEHPVALGESFGAVHGARSTTVQLYVPCTLKESGGELLQVRLYSDRQLDDGEIIDEFQPLLDPFADFVRIVSEDVFACPEASELPDGPVEFVR